MRVLAVRDDGAQLIGEPELPVGLLMSPEGSVILPVASILARGYWGRGKGEAQVRPEVAERIRRAAAEYNEHEFPRQ